MGHSNIHDDHRNMVDSYLGCWDGTLLNLLRSRILEIPSWMATRNPVNEQKQLRLVIYPMIYKVLAPSKRWLFGISEPSTVPSGSFQCILVCLEQVVG